MHSLIAFSESQDEGGVMTAMAAVVDQTVKTNGDQLTVPPFRTLIGAVSFLGALSGVAKLDSPSIRRVNQRYINANTNALYPGQVHPMWLQSQQSFMLEYNEALQAYNNANPAAAERHTVVCAIADGDLSPVTGKMITVMAQTTLALTGGVWDFGNIDLVDELPVGKYQVVGARAVVATGIAFRMVPVGSYQRPGGLCAQGNDTIEDPRQRYGGLGVWFEFDTTQLPGIEIISSAAAGSTTYNLFLDVLVQ